MDEKLLIKSGIRKIGFALVTQALILGCSLVTSLIVPKYMKKEIYGQWQIYYFYLNYINFVTFGYNDGAVLKYGGMRREDLPIEKIRSGNLIMLCLSLLVAVGGIICVKILNLSDSSSYIFSMLFASMPFVCVFNVILSFFLAVNEQEKYNIINFLNRFFATIGYCVLLAAGVNGYIPMIEVDYGIRALIAVICIIIGVYFWRGKRAVWREGWQAVRENCGSGILITMGALCASFAPLAGRVVLEHRATISEYASFSFAMSILSLIVTFTNAAGIVFFPMLKKLDKQDMPQYYGKIKNLYNKLIFGALFCYVPAVLFIKYFMVEYIEVLEYIFLIVAICIPLGKLQILITPYMKAYRMERGYFVVNLLSAVCVWLCDTLVYSLFSSVFGVAAVTLVIYELWSLVLEYYLKKKIGLDRTECGKEAAVLLFFLIMAFSGKLAIFVAGYCCAVFFVIYRHKNHRKKKKD